MLPDLHPALANRQHHRSSLPVVVAGILAGVLGLSGGYYLGQRAAYGRLGADPLSYHAMQSELVTARGASQALEAELDIQRTRHEVDRRALDLVRKEMTAQKDQIVGLEEGLGFYRSLMTPGEVTRTALVLRDVELVAGDGPRNFLYQIVVQQEARKHELLKGRLSVMVFGMEGGERVEYSLVELGEDSEDEVFQLRFRYFQSIEGEINLPEGFEPQGLTVVVSSRTPHRLEVREEFPWQLQARFTHVGK
jgi:hypothetical protein